MYHTGRARKGPAVICNSAPILRALPKGVVSSQGLD